MPSTDKKRMEKKNSMIMDWRAVERVIRCMVQDGYAI